MEYNTWMSILKITPNQTHEIGTKDNGLLTHE